MQRVNRMKKELQMLDKSPPPGISCSQVDDKIDALQATIVGTSESPYQGGVFELDISVPERYPFEPPSVTFKTPIYHPNIDTSGRICLDILKMPPKGGWKPALNLSTLLTSIRLLMSSPNPDDPLMADISSEYKTNYEKYFEKAKQWTKKHAMDKHHVNLNKDSLEEANPNKRQTLETETDPKRLKK